MPTINNKSNYNNQYEFNIKGKNKIKVKKPNKQGAKKKIEINEIRRETEVLVVVNNIKANVHRIISMWQSNRGDW